MDIDNERKNELNYRLLRIPRLGRCGFDTVAIPVSEESKEEEREQKLKTQDEERKRLMELLKEHPDLPIIPIITLEFGLRYGNSPISEDFIEGEITSIKLGNDPNHGKGIYVYIYVKEIM